MGILVDLVSLGVTGASLAFLYLGYRLLRREQEKRDREGNPVSIGFKNVAGIGFFLIFSLVFFILGASIEIYKNYEVSRKYAHSWVTFMLGADMVGPEINVVGFHPEQKWVKVGFKIKPLDLNHYVPREGQETREVFFGIRKKRPRSWDTGEYPIVIGPYNFATITEQTIDVSKKEFDFSDQDCITFTMFVSEKGFLGTVSEPFNPGIHEDVRSIESHEACT